MKIEQRPSLLFLKRFSCLLLVLFITVAGVIPVMAADDTTSDISGYYEFTGTPLFPIAYDEPATGKVAFFWNDVYVDFVTVADGKQYSSMHAQYDPTDISRVQLYFDDVLVYVYVYSVVYSEYTGFWVEPAYSRLRFLQQSVDSWFKAWLDNAGTFSTVNDQLTPPDLDPDELIPDAIGSNEYVHLASIFYSLWESPVLLGYVTSLFAMLIVSFIFFGSKK